MRFKSDDQFTKKERALVQRDLNNQNKAIYREKNDQQKRFKGVEFNSKILP